MKHLGMHAACLASVSAALAGGITVDGVLDAEYGDVNGVQNTQTAFGDSTMGLPDFTPVHDHYIKMLLDSMDKGMVNPEMIETMMRNSAAKIRSRSSEGSFTTAMKTT